MLQNKCRRFDTLFPLAIFFFFSISVFIANANIDDYYVFAWDNQSLNGGQVGKDGCPNDPAANLFDADYTGQTGLISPCDTTQYSNCGWSGAACTIPTVTLYVQFNSSLTIPANSINITCGTVNQCPITATLYRSNDNITYTLVGTDSSIINTGPSAILDLPAFSATYWKIVFTNNLAGNGLMLYEFDILNDSVSESGNSMPDLSISNLKGVYCLNHSDYNYEFYISPTDEENDEIYYYAYWNQDQDPEIIVDDFSDDDYHMSANGWAFSGAGCNYTTAYGSLNLYSGCSGIQISKVLDHESLSESLDVMFEAWVYEDTTNEYCLYNWYNEKTVCLKLTADYDETESFLYTNLSYWNGSQYIVFNSSYYTGIFGVKFELNTSWVHICISGENTPLYAGCDYEIYEEQHGIFDNIAAKFQMMPTFTTLYNDTAFVYLDNLKYQNNENINWIHYQAPGTYDYISHLIEEEGAETLTILVTDSVHTPLYETYTFPITVMGDCAKQTQFNETAINTTAITEETRDFIDAFDNGPAIFNQVFYFILLIGLFILIISSHSLEVSLIIAGLIGMFISWIMSGDIEQLITCAVMVGFGVTVLITKSV